MCDISTIVFLKNLIGGKDANIVSEYYDEIIDLNIKYLNTEYKTKISSSTMIMYLGSLIKFNSDKCKFYLENGNMCNAVEKLSLYINKDKEIKEGRKELVLNCITNQNSNLNLNKIMKLFVDNKQLDSDIRGKKIYSIKGAYMKFDQKNHLSFLFGNDIEFHLDLENENAKEFIRRKLSSHIMIKVNNVYIDFNYRWKTDRILIIPLLYSGLYEINMKPMILDRETEKELNTSVLESYISEEFTVN
jgi:hypothetical protein